MNDLVKALLSAMRAKEWLEADLAREIPDDAREADEYLLWLAEKTIVEMRGLIGLGICLKNAR